MASLQDLQNQLAAYQATETRILNGSQDATIGGRRYTLADLEIVQEKIRQLETRIVLVQASQYGGPPVTHSEARFRGRR
jgi:hypothetical protein